MFQVRGDEGKAGKGGAAGSGGKTDLGSAMTASGLISTSGLVTVPDGTHALGGPGCRPSLGTSRARAGKQSASGLLTSHGPLCLSTRHLLPFRWDDGEAPNSLLGWSPLCHKGFVQLFFHFFVSRKHLRLSSSDAHELSGFQYWEWGCSLPCPRYPFPCVLSQEGLRASASLN